MICIILGTRPEIIKMYPVISKCQEKNIPYFILHTGQHYSYEMDKIFFKELGIDSRKMTNLNIGSGTHGQMTGQMIMKIEEVLMKRKPEVVLVQGDTNTVVAGALASVKLNIPIGHIEAGLRSYDRSMPEEHNRIIADHISDFLFVPTKKSANILKKEGLDPKRIFITGNTIVDSVLKNYKASEKKSKILKQLKLRPKEYILATIHRQENTDQKNRLKNILKGIEEVSRKTDLPVIYPMHPRARKKIKDLKLKVSPRIKIIEPVGFFDFLSLEKNAKIILTDSGGVQEEACILKTPCITLRDNTERPETIEVGANILSGADHKKILQNTLTLLSRNKNNWSNPFGDGKSAEKIISILKKNV